MVLNRQHLLNPNTYSNTNTYFAVSKFSGISPDVLIYGINPLVNFNPRSLLHV